MHGVPQATSQVQLTMVIPTDNERRANAIFCSPAPCPANQGSAPATRFISVSCIVLKTSHYRQQGGSPSRKALADMTSPMVWCSSYLLRLQLPILFSSQSSRQGFQWTYSQRRSSMHLLKLCNICTNMKPSDIWSQQQAFTRLSNCPWSILESYWTFFYYHM